MAVHMLSVISGGPASEHWTDNSRCEPSMNAFVHVQRADGGADSGCAVFVAANGNHVLAKFSVDTCSGSH